MQIIPLQTVPSQTVSITLNNQICQINVYQKSGTIYVDLYVDLILVIGGVACWNNNVIVRSGYLGFDGDLAFIDTQGSLDPTYPGIGDRFFLAYFTKAEVAALPFVPSARYGSWDEFLWDDGTVWA
jgi:hypothetical protein